MNRPCILIALTRTLNSTIHLIRVTYVLGSYHWTDLFYPRKILDCFDWESRFRFIFETVIERLRYHAPQELFESFGLTAGTSELLFNINHRIFK